MRLFLIAIGEIGIVLAKGCLKPGFSLYPVTGETDSQRLAGQIDQPPPVVVAVGENG